jgi:hypothetical protein
MSCEELVSLTRRYKSMAHDVMAEASQKLSVSLDAEPGSGPDNETRMHEFPPLSPTMPAGEGPSCNKGKGPDPGNWGTAGFSVDFSEQQIEAQREALNNFAEINHIIKQEKANEFVPNLHVPSVEPMESTVKIPRRKPIVSDPLPKNKGTNQPGQANAEQIAELENELRRLRQLDVPQRPASWKPSSKAKLTVEQKIANLIRGDKSVLESNSRNPRGATPSRITAGSFLDKAIHGAARLSHDPPSSEPSDSSSSSFSESSLP